MEDATAHILMQQGAELHLAHLIQILTRFATMILQHWVYKLLEANY